MTQQPTIPTRSNMKFSDQRFAAGHESSPKNDISYARRRAALNRTAEVLGQGFKVAKGSDITPRDLAQAFFAMKDFLYYPSDIKEVERRINYHFAISRRLGMNFCITDCSTHSERIYLFESCQF